MKNFRKKNVFYDLKGTGVYELGREVILQTVEDTELHSHPGRFEVIACLKGRAQYCYGAKKLVCLPGTAVLSAPNRRHCLLNCHKALDTLYAEFDLTPRWGLSAAERTTLTRRLLRRSGKVLTLTVRLKECLRRMLALAAAQRSPKPSPLMEVELRTAALEMALALAAAPDFVETTVPNAQIAGWLEQVRRVPAQRHPLKDTAQKMGLSGPDFEAAVKRATGYTAHAYVLKCRVERAKEMLKEAGRSVGFVADSLGFCGSQHFAFVFRKFTGLTPTEWACSDGNKN